MTSPFTQIPQSEWLASNDLAFAIFDAYPVTEGHTLVIPRREVATWFDATADERRALMNLIDEVKPILDERFQPDGYNIGINIGEDAGQTVMHLHVHVIPRYKGDVEDPRGGVRYVIPDKANYLANSDDDTETLERPSSESLRLDDGIECSAQDRRRMKKSPGDRHSLRHLSTGGHNDYFIDHLRPLIARAQQIAVVAAFIQDSGLELLRDPILSSLERGAEVRLLTGDYFAITQVRALERLLDWQTASEITETTGDLYVRVVEVGRNDGWPKSFHPKSWHFETDESGVAFVGSSNISRLALTEGTEWNLRVSSHKDLKGFREVTKAFDAQWSRAHRLTPQWIEKYRLRTQVHPQPLPVGEAQKDAPEPLPEPHEIQREALNELEKARRNGRRRALVVHATGLGKTWLAAFDIRRFSEHYSNWPRVLFLAHRAEILQQAADTFRNLLLERDGEVSTDDIRGPHKSSKTSRAPEFGWFIGQKSDLNGDVVFASVQKLRRDEHLAQLDEDSFDYVVVDEVHHAAAPSYRRILNHLEPEFLLGLTATPDRADEADIRTLFDDFVAHRAPIGTGIEMGYLCPFHYHGIRDTTDYEPIPWRSGRFQTERLTKEVATHERMQRIADALEDHPAKRTLIFCCSIDHARFVRDWFTERGLNIAAIYSGDDSDDRDASLRALAAGDLDAVCAVDILNEGVDIPRIDRVVMLRPTESPVVFMQQLGRGLRTADGKDHLIVLDFVGNHHVFLDRVRTLLSLGQKPTSLRQFLVKDGEPDLPPGCLLDIELEAVELLRDLLPQSSRSSLVREYRELYAARDHRPTAVEMHKLGFNLRNLKRYGGWFGFLADESNLSDAEHHAWTIGEDWFHELETTNLTKCYKMVVIRALLDADALDTGMSVDALADRSHRILTRSPELFDDLVGIKKLPNPRNPDPDVWRKYWDEWPLKVWAGDKGRHIEQPWFERPPKDGGLFFASRVPVPKEAEKREAFLEMTRELVDYRLAKYRERFSRTDVDIGAFRVRIVRNKRHPIIQLPSRKSRPDLPSGETTVILPDGQKWRFRFGKVAINVARPVGDRQNRLPDLLRTWFGPAAGEGGTNYEVEFRPTRDGWRVEPLGHNVIPFPRPNHVITFPSVEAAAGAHRQVATETPEWTQRRLLTRDKPDGHFAVLVRGDSMAGGDDPINDGDWALMKWARGEPLAKVGGRIALVRHSIDEETPPAYFLKRIVKTHDGFELRSDNPASPPIKANEEMTVIALHTATLRDADLLTPREAKFLDALRRELVRQSDVDVYEQSYWQHTEEFVECLRNIEALWESIEQSKLGDVRHRVADALCEIYDVPGSTGKDIVGTLFGNHL